MQLLALAAEIPWAHLAADSGVWAVVPPPRTARASDPKICEVPLPLRIGTRTLATIRRRLVRHALGLSDILCRRAPDLGHLPGDANGFCLTSIPVDRLDVIAACHPDLKILVRNVYPRSFTDLSGSFEDWSKDLSARSRSTLKRKIRRFAERSGGRPDLRAYRLPAEMEEFHRHARTVSELSYQEKRLGRGLPDGPAFLRSLQLAAAKDRVRGWILFLDGRPISYLYAPAEGDVLIYDHLGYDPAFAELSPGTVLQAGAMEHLFAERRFRYFDFTEGGGRHKEFFATGSVDCADILLLRRSAINLTLAGILLGFDRTLTLAKSVATRLGLRASLRKLVK